MNNPINLPIFKVIVPYNNPTMVEGRKKQKKLAGIVLTIVGIIFGIFAIMASIGADSIALGLFFGAFVVFALASAAYQFLTIKPNSKNDNKIVSFLFFEDGLEINQENLDKKSSKNLTRCLYRSYKNKQFVNKILEDETKFDISVYTGTYNMVPQYKGYTLPKDAINSEDIQAFIDFLKQRLLNDYVIKQKK